MNGVGFLPIVRDERIFELVVWLLDDVLRDGLFEAVTVDHIREVVVAKVGSAGNVDDEAEVVNGIQQELQPLLKRGVFGAEEVVRLVVEHQRAAAGPAKTVGDGGTCVLVNRVDVLDADVAALDRFVAALQAGDRAGRAQLTQDRAELVRFDEGREFAQQPIFDGQRRAQDQDPVDQPLGERKRGQGVHDVALARAGCQVERGGFLVLQRQPGKQRVEVAVALADRFLLLGGPVGAGQAGEVGILIRDEEAPRRAHRVALESVFAVAQQVQERVVLMDERLGVGAAIGHVEHLVGHADLEAHRKSSLR